ncbi:hypothetical protein LGH82_27710 [Mesorhizobium sp. PAMC28654]|uniref:hypothetical protein n=1 Tax=Mesorhizobium sp. PAMC28654 TaxID=2880934 RepID=UPI001D0AF1FB|nr:hypothetical protein [Mesorhizobium sp. PAMC28654]UDL88854.1 hypothetical protein LGH82_27710 [Mesorhizobium sp. PAMC28654]
MSNRNRFADAALGVVFGVGIALLFLVWTVPGFRDPADPEVRKQYNANVQGGNNDPVKPEGFWKTYTTPSDTYAQWVAAISAALGLGVSIWAVRLVRDTLDLNRASTKAAQDAVSITGTIGERQLRAYLSIDKMEVVFVVGEVVTVKVSLINAGQTPARHVRVLYSGIKSEDPNTSKFFFGAQPIRSKLDVGPGRPMLFNITGNEPLSDETYTAVKKKTAYIVVAGIVTYRDIFGKSRRVIFKGYVNARAKSERIESIGVSLGLEI